MTSLGLEHDVIDRETYHRALDWFRSAGIALPTFAQLAAPDAIPAAVVTPPVTVIEAPSPTTAPVDSPEAPPAAQAAPSAPPAAQAGASAPASKAPRRSKARSALRVGPDGF